MSGITLVVEDRAWRSHRGLQASLTRAADAARRSAKLKGGFTILLANDRKLRALNRDFRRKDKPTNVLSFPMYAPEELLTLEEERLPEIMLGDIVLARETCLREAADKDLPVATHATHLIVHGVLHLLGYDHIDDEDAENMEALERRIMADLGHDDPYGD